VWFWSFSSKCFRWVDDSIWVWLLALGSFSLWLLVGFGLSHCSFCCRLVILSGVLVGVVSLVFLYIGWMVSWPCCAMLLFDCYFLRSIVWWDASFYFSRLLFVYFHWWRWRLMLLVIVLAFALFRSAVISVYVLLSAVSPTGCHRFLLLNICVPVESRFTRVRCQVALTVSFSSDLSCIVLVFLLLCLFLCVIFLAACVLLFGFTSYHFVCGAWFLWFSCCCVGSEICFFVPLILPWLSWIIVSSPVIDLSMCIVVNSGCGCLWWCCAIVLISPFSLLLIWLFDCLFNLYFDFSRDYASCWLDFVVLS
jgi:hypothetical protein